MNQAITVPLQKEYCPGHLANGEPCPNILYIWDEERQQPRVMYRNKNLLWLPQGVPVDVRCGRCGTKSRIEWDTEDASPRLMGD